MVTISEAVEIYLQNIARERSPHTAKSYRSGLNVFQRALASAGVDAETADVASLDESWITTLIESLADSSPATETLYLTANSNFYHYLAAERLAAPNLPRL